MKKYVIIVAGGSGTRMKSEVPKQFMELKGQPVLMRTMQKFSDVYPDIHIIVVLAKELEESWKQLCIQYNFKLQHEVTGGGETRYHSVKNGLQLVPGSACVGIHDAARPLVSESTIRAAFEKAISDGNASPVVPVTDSIRFLKDKENCALDRTKYVVVQTPQCFHADLIKKAFEKPYRPEFTDDASVLEAFGEKINLVEGNPENIKITTPQDMVVAEVLMGN
ncbi:MAG: 2-C-methyl-D-erythritol 4-phosphate cytidylyltransferase [Bacteroidia bacterium]